VQRALVNLAFRAAGAAHFNAAPPAAVELAVPAFPLGGLGAARVFAPPPTACDYKWVGGCLWEATVHVNVRQVEAAV
jgi:hypothetical protein